MNYCRTLQILAQLIFPFVFSTNLTLHAIILSLSIPLYPLAACLPSPSLFSPAVTVNLCLPLPPTAARYKPVALRWWWGRGRAVMTVRPWWTSPRASRHATPFVCAAVIWRLMRRIGHRPAETRQLLSEASTSRYGRSRMQNCRDICKCSLLTELS